MDSTDCKTVVCDIISLVFRALEIVIPKYTRYQLTRDLLAKRVEARGEKSTRRDFSPQNGP